MDKQVYYKFMSLDKLERFLDYLAHSYLYGAKYKELNDPFEGRFKSNNLAKSIKGTIYEKLYRTRICSMFKRREGQSFPDDFLMWSHYANSHKGCCLEFTLTNRYNTEWEIKDIVYNTQMPDAPNDSDESIYTILSHKTPVWEMENEVRAIRIYKKGKENNSHYYHIKLKAIYFGLSTESKNTNILVRIIEALHPEVFVYKIEKDRENRNCDYPSLKTKCLNPKGND